MANYAELPAGVKLDVKPFTAHVPEQKLQDFKKLLELSPIAPPAFENTHAGRTFGITRDWLENAKRVWLNDFDWRKCEDRINSFPNFKAIVEDTEGNDTEIQFLALFSGKSDAIPIVFIHGWPGSICEFLDMLEILKNKYPNPKDLPYHVIVPSIPGYAYSSGPHVEVDYGISMAAQAINSLMVGLGFESGYLTQGGDLGSFISRVLALSFDSCKGMHVNQMAMPSPEKKVNIPLDPTDEHEKTALQRAAEMLDTGMAFLLEHGTKAATIGFVLSSSPLALLCWIGEKFLAWSDEEPELEKILESVTLYWLTDTISRCLYHNRDMGDPDEKPKIARTSAVTKLDAIRLPFVDKPTGYSRFAQEIVPAPKSWATLSCNLVSYNEHERGGHFAAMERPNELLADVEEYVEKVWKSESH